jgi:isopenicillin N synthase-like dioxygenase
MIPRIDAAKLTAADPDAVEAMRVAATDVGFATVHNTRLSPAQVQEVIDMYRAFFRLPESDKRKLDMTRTGANRGWGGPGSEQVDPDANPDYKQVFDTGFTLPQDDARSALSVYASNQWPDAPEGFRRVIEGYYQQACGVALDILRGVARAINAPVDYFDQQFEVPMALMRGNFYPERPAHATDKDFGIATHTDYGCLTLLATDGAPGLEVRKRGGGWIPLSVEPGTFAINFGEMMEFWTGGKVTATPHRVVGGNHERISVPLFFNPSHDTNVAPPGSDKVIRAGDHLERRFSETYVHLKKA